MLQQFIPQFIPLACVLVGASYAAAVTASRLAVRLRGADGRTLVPVEGSPDQSRPTRGD